MTLPAIGAISAALPNFAATTGISDPGLGDLGIQEGSTSSTSGNFAAMLEKGLNAVQSAQSKADGLAVQAATGDLTDIHDYTIAATQASLVTQLATTVRTKGVDAFNQIMGMQA
ncbi:MAG TPA: flagellar hook-basal body complex protein FliE [Jatrophihabitans sp.]|jgi:flagellar hook-basal body complex protein FliE|uniref:flagellar hook-basal body complex protein FliE n=1 Tax=Jatrophihabitans sp. TaxID=1932789 RepID=UPI002EE9A3AD